MEIVTMMQFRVEFGVKIGEARNETALARVWDIFFFLIDHLDGYLSFKIQVPIKYERPSNFCLKIPILPPNYSPYESKWASSISPSLSRPFTYLKLKIAE